MTGKSERGPSDADFEFMAAMALKGFADQAGANVVAMATDEQLRDALKKFFRWLRDQQSRN